MYPWQVSTDHEFAEYLKRLSSYIGEELQKSVRKNDLQKHIQRTEKILEEVEGWMSQLPSQFKDQLGPGFIHQHVGPWVIHTKVFKNPHK